MIHIWFQKMEQGGGEETLELDCRGHAGEAEKGKDILCSAVSILMQTLAIQMDDARNTGLLDGLDILLNNGEAHITVKASPAYRQWVQSKFDFALAGIELLTAQYPNRIHYNRLFSQEARYRRGSMVDLQLFAEDGGEGAGGTEGTATEESVQLPRAERRQAAATGTLGKDRHFSSGDKPHLSRAEYRQALAAGTIRPTETEEAAKSAAEMTETTEQTSEAEEKKSKDTRFLEMLRGDYKAEFDHLMQVMEEERKKTAVPPRPMPNAVHDDAYFERYAREHGVTVKTAQMIDRMEQNRRQEQGTQAVRRVQQRWAEEEAALRRTEPQFALGQELKNPRFRQMLLAGVGLEDAYHAVHYSSLLDASVQRTAQAVEQGVSERIRRRSVRPSENGLQNGGAVKIAPDVKNLSRADREKIEQRVFHGARVLL